jgi:hypothetical protein
MRASSVEYFNVEVIRLLGCLPGITPEAALKRGSREDQLATAALATVAGVRPKSAGSSGSFLVSRATFYAISDWSGCAPGPITSPALAAIDIRAWQISRRRSEAIGSLRSARNAQAGLRRHIGPHQTSRFVPERTKGATKNQGAAEYWRPDSWPALVWG